MTSADPAAADALAADARASFWRGDEAAARAAYAACLALSPDHAEANFQLGVLWVRAEGDFAAALNCFRRAYDAHPTHNFYWQALLTALIDQNRIDEALAVHGAGTAAGLRAPAPLRLPPDEAAAIVEATPEQAVRRVQRERQSAPARAWRLALQAGERWPDSHELCQLQTQLAISLSQWRAALHSAQRWASLQPESAVALTMLTLAAQRNFQYELAARSAAQVLALGVKNPGLELVRAEALECLGRTDEAIDSLQRAWSFAPGDLVVFGQLCGLLQEKGDFMALRNLAQSMVAVNPRHAGAYSTLGAAALKLGDHEAALAAFERSLAVDPEDVATRSVWLFCLNYLSRWDADRRRAEAERYGDLLRRGTVPMRLPVRAMRRPLRLGFLSGDLRAHPVAYFLLSLIEHLDPDRAIAMAYVTHAKRDSMSERLASRFSAWRVVDGMHSRDIADLIVRDGIDVLIDLSGHTSNSGLPCMVYRPAPLQLSWLGYFATTGMREIDAVLADEICVPPDAVSAFTERVVYLPDTRLCFSPPPDAPPIAPAPSLGGKPVTFGCFQNLAKVNDAVLDVWRRIFERLPSARLRVQSTDLGSASSRDRFVGRLRAAGIDVDRVDLHGPTERLAYLSCHAEVDAVLDTFPFPGGTTTCEALWMGVPTITLCGDSMISRQGAALMHAARLPQFVCANLDAYVERALAIADDPCLRARLQFRERLASAPLFDAPQFARQFVDTVEALFEASLNTVG